MLTHQKATKARTKEHNKRLILTTIYDEREISRAAVSRSTALTRPTVSTIVAELMEEGLVAEVGVTPSGGGKPATLLSVVDDARQIIGIDLANSEFRGAVINLRGEIQHHSSEPILERDGKAALALVHKLLEELLALANKPLLGIGIGTPGLMDADHGVVRTAVNLDWQNLPLADILTERYSLPTYIANDGQVAALAEYTFGERRDTENLVVLKVGRGIGSGIIIGGSLYYGDDFGAGEIGHFKVVEGGEPCRCGNFGCLETISSTHAIVRQARMIATSSPQSLLNDLVSSPSDINTETVLSAVISGDPTLENVLNNAGKYLGLSVAGLVSILNIRHVVIAGSAARFGDAMVQPLLQEMRRRALPPLAEHTVVTTSSLGTDIVILGAAALVLANELELVR